MIKNKTFKHGDVVVAEGYMASAMLMEYIPNLEMIFSIRHATPKELAQGYKDE